MRCWYPYLPLPFPVPYWTSFVEFLFADLVEVMDRLQQGLPQPVNHVAETTDTGGEESDAVAGSKKVLSFKEDSPNEEGLGFRRGCTPFWHWTWRYSGKAQSLQQPDL